MAGSNASGDFDNGELFGESQSQNVFSDGRIQESTYMPVPSAPPQMVQSGHEGRLMADVQTFGPGARSTMHVDASAPPGEGMSSSWRLFASLTSETPQPAHHGAGNSPLNYSAPYVQATTGPSYVKGQGGGKGAQPALGSNDANVSFHPPAGYNPYDYAATGAGTISVQPSPSCEKH